MRFRVSKKVAKIYYLFWIIVILFVILTIFFDEMNWFGM